MRAVLVPGVLALLPEYAGLVDPVAELRAACLDAVAWLGPGPVEILADPQGRRVAEALLSAVGGFETGLRPSSTTESYLVVGNGSARRTEKAPGHLDERSFAFDDALRAALVSKEPQWPSSELGSSLLASLDGIQQAGDLLSGEATVDYDDDPFGVQYWVMRWQS
ncbi:hypothetical protein ABLE68_11130 [Nocardioides sp. CN2-186]|uniref:hypothetical protein n=1 Tax=Nocardioides tweenelious TaxID=3156607 RepID=UPI0032B60BA6